MIRIFPGMAVPVLINGRKIHAPTHKIVGFRSDPRYTWDFGISTPTYTATELGMDNTDLQAYLSHKAIAGSLDTPITTAQVVLALMRAVEHQLIVHLGAFYRRKHALEAFRRFN
jgi:hypothetical protein